MVGVRWLEGWGWMVGGVGLAVMSGTRTVLEWIPRRWEVTDPELHSRISTENDRKPEA